MSDAKSVFRVYASESTSRVKVVSGYGKARITPVRLLHYVT